MHDIWNPWHGCVKCSEGSHMPKAVPHRSIKTPTAEEIINCELSEEATLKHFKELFDAGRVETTVSPKDRAFRRNPGRFVIIR